MKKKHLSLLISSLFGLIACGDILNKSPSSVDNTLPKNITKINFDILSDPQEPTLISPTYLSIDSDGTLDVEKRVRDPTNDKDPLISLGKTDGWGTTQPIEISFTGLPLDPHYPPDSFYLIKSPDPTLPLDSTQTQKLKEGEDYRIKIVDNRLTAILLKPLSSSSHYMFAVTNDLKNIEGHPVEMSPSYEALKTNISADTAELRTMQAITHATENALETVGLDKSRIVFSSWFTTTSIVDVLHAAKMATARAIKDGAETVWKGHAIAEGITIDELTNLFSLSTPVEDKDTGGGLGKIYHGQVNMPYFLDIRKEHYQTTPWQSGMPSVAKIRHVLLQGSAADKKTVTEQIIRLGLAPEELIQPMTSEPLASHIITALTGTDLKLANGDALDSEKIITRYSPLPALKSVQKIEYSLILPNRAECQNEKSNALTVYMHGVTNSKNSLFRSELIDELMTGRCKGIIVIDHPLHGKRGIDNQNASLLPTMYLNFDFLTVGRDNLRQSAIDVINLRAAIGLVFDKIRQQSDAVSSLGALARLNPNAPVSFAGHSLGAITGINVGHISNRSTGDLEVDKNLFHFDKFAIANPGSGIPFFLYNSKSFHLLLKGSSLVIQDPDFISSCGNLNITLCYSLFESQLKNDGSPEAHNKLKEMYGVFTRFAHITQNIMDTIDPINHSSYLTDIPVYLTQVKDDKIIPNFILEETTVSGTDILVPYSPFGGTSPLIRALSLTPTMDSIQNKKVRNAVLFNQGHHSSLLLSNTSPSVTREMQSQIQSFLNSDGNTLTITDPSVLETP